MKKLIIPLLLLIGIIYEVHAQPQCGTMRAPAFTQQSIVPESATTASGTFAWTNVGATSYTLHYGIQGGGLTTACSNSLSCTINGLQLGKTYVFVVEASRPCRIRNEDFDDDVKTVSTTLSTPPPAPTGLTISAITSASFRATWTATPGATGGYLLDVADNMAFSNPVLNNVTVTGTIRNVTGPGLRPATTYFVRVQAVGGGGSSRESEIVSVLLTPDLATNLNASEITQTSFLATWSPSPGATGHLIDVFNSSDQSLIFNHVPVGTSFRATGLPPGGIYHYVVWAVNASGATNSQPFSVVTIPATPTGLAVSGIEETAAILSWSPAAGAASYKLDVSPDRLFETGNILTNFEVSASTNLIVLLRSSLTPGTTYHFKMRSHNRSGDSPDSQTISFTTLSPSITLDTEVINASSCGWDSPIQVNSSTSWEIVTPVPDEIRVYNVTAQSFRVTVSPNPVFIPREFTINVRSVEAPAVTATLRIQQEASPLLSATPGNRQARLTWGAFPAGCVEGFLIYRSIDGGAPALIASLSGGNSEYIATDLDNDTTYTFHLRVIDWNGNLSEFSPPVFVTPHAPRFITLSQPSISVPLFGELYSINVNSNSPWTIGTMPEEAILEQVTSEGFQIRVSPNRSGMPRSFQATVVTTAGDVSATLTLIQDGPPQLVAIPGNNEVNLNWGPAVEGASQYNIYEPLIGQLIATVPASQLSFTHTGLVNGRTYTYAITAVGSQGIESGLSNILSVAPRALPFITLDREAIDASSCGGNSTIQVNSNTPWVTTSLPDWIRVHNVTSQGFKVFTDPNRTFTPREFTITLESVADPISATLLVRQEGLSLLSAVPGGGKAVLTWIPLTSGCIAGQFQILRSVNGVLSTEALLEGSNSTYTVEGLENGTTYTFHLREIDALGGSELSPPVSVTPQGQNLNEQSLSAYPNPVDNTLQLRGQIQTPGSYSATIFNSSGAPLLQQQIYIENGKVESDINVSTLQPGLYLFRLTGPSTETIRFKKK